VRVSLVGTNTALGPGSGGDIGAGVATEAEAASDAVVCVRGTESVGPGAVLQEARAARRRRERVCIVVMDARAATMVYERAVVATGSLQFPRHR